MDPFYFTAAELTFLKHHGLAAKDVFNGGTLNPRDYVPKAEAAGKFLVYAKDKCARKHNLKTTSGHCPQCSPSVLALGRRHHTEGFIFVAHSKSAGATKVGVTENMDIRARTINVSDAGKRTDWVILFSAPCKEMGLMEKEVHKGLAEHSLKGMYLDDRDPANDDLFKCAPEFAITVVKNLLDTMG
jgi:hypothetical protein